MNEIHKRFGIVIGYLIYQGIVDFKSTQKDLANKIDMDYSNISKALKGDDTHSKTLISKINKSFGDMFNDNFIFTGEGSMLKTADAPAEVNIDYKEKYIDLMEKYIKLIDWLGSENTGSAKRGVV
jgi:transcriptional regulator with XRE-family HTH domain